MPLIENRGGKTDGSLLVFSIFSTGLSMWLVVNKQ
jgi:hypothetical protein